MKKVVVVGAGAAGFFAAINCAEKNPDYEVLILEKSPKFLAKVKISGGGRCNVTHACFDARQLIKNYPRGEKQLMGPFTRFNPTHTIDWFAARGVELKTEEDGRMFPTTDTSQTIINCFWNEARRLGIKVEMQCGVEGLAPIANGWSLETTNGYINADAVLITTGGIAQVWRMLQNLGLSIIEPVPSLFTFNIKDARIKGLEGVSVPMAQVKIKNSKLSAEGPLLITHWGLSGPGILKLSAWGARELAAINYQFDIEVNWTGDKTVQQVTETLKQYKQQHPKQTVGKHNLFGLPARLWIALVTAAGNEATLNQNFADLSNKVIEQIAAMIAAGQFKVEGKSTFKDEFVTAGGVDLNEIDFKTMQSKKHPGLYFAGEVLDIDAITGGFNFQAAWTTGWIAGQSV
ncbi:MAG: NAD(P)/FAD-dependent oxidoreductase [Chitinophagales bacterium]